MAAINDKCKDLLMTIFSHRKVFFLPSLGRCFKDVHLDEFGDLIFVTMDGQGRKYTPEMLETYVLSDLQIIVNHIESEIKAKQQYQLITQMQDEKAKNQSTSISHWSQSKLF